MFTSSVRGPSGPERVIVRRPPGGNHPLQVTPHRPSALDDRTCGPRENPGVRPHRRRGGDLVFYPLDHPGLPADRHGRHWHELDLGPVDAWATDPYTRSRISA